VKKFSMIIVALLLTSSILTACNVAGTPMKVKVATDASFPPFEDVDLDNRKIIGFDIELMKAIAGKANLEVEFVNLGYDKLLTAMGNCEYDAAISAIPISDDLKQKMTFSEPYYKVGQVVVVKAGNSAVTSKDQLAGMVVGAQRNTSSASEVVKIAGANFKSYASVDLAYKDLIYGVIDAVVSDKPMALSYANTKANNLKIVGDEFAVDDLGVAVCSQKADLVKRINDALAVFKFDGTINQLAQKWIISATQ
jgi:polar amino acid transport system substrate-binding protein